jgi:hypothetical protein
MRQSFHIFRKDVRHLKWELLLMLSLIAAFVIVEPQRWRPLYELKPFRQAGNLVQMLMGLAWCYIVVRLVHEEALAGDRQFWITRPYSWKSLWAAKLLFILVFINIPVLIADAIILASAGFPPVAHLPVLVWKQIALTAGLATAVAMAAVTRNLLEFGLACFVVAHYTVVFEVVYRSWPVQGWIQVWVLTAILLGAASALVLYQYARRRTLVSRLALVGLALFMLLAMSRITWNLVVSNRFAALASQTTGSPALVFDPDPARRPTDKFIYTVGDVVPIRIPFQVAGLPEGTDIESAIASVSIEAPGVQNWFNYGSFHYFPLSGKSGEVGFSVNQRLFDEIKSTPVTLRLSVLLTLFRDDSTAKVELREGDFSVPNVFNCVSSGSYMESPLCRSTLLRRRPLRISFTVPETCGPVSRGVSQGPVPRGELRVIRTGTGWEPHVLDLDISPVRASYISLRQWPNSASSNASPDTPDCSGTQVEFTTESEVTHIRRDVEVRGVRLADYAMKFRRYP